MRTGQIRTIAVGAASVQVAGFSEDRVLIAFSVPGTTVVCVNNRPLIANTDGIGLVANSNVFEMGVEDYGALVQDNWHAFAQGASQNVTVIEVWER